MPEILTEVVWRLAAENVVYLETMFSPDLGTRSVLVPMMQRLLDFASLWDVVKLSGFHSGIPVTIATLTSCYKLAVPLGRHCNSNSILLSRGAAEVLLDHLLPMRLPYDHALEQAWLYGLRLRIVSPAPCPAETGLASTIATQATRHGKLPFYRRIPTLLFRSRTEFSRVAYGLLHVARAKLFRS